MDLSKLPRFSSTPPPPNDAPTATDPASPSPSSANAPFSTTPIAPSGSTSSTSSPSPLFCRCGAPLPAGSRFCSSCGATYAEATGDARASILGGMWVEALMSIGVGLFLLFMAPRGISYWKTQLFGGNFVPFPTGQTIQMQNLQTGALTSYTYQQLLSGFWSDTAITSFALVLILEGLVLGLVRNRWVILLSAVLVAAVTFLNLWVVIAGYRTVDPTATMIGQSYGLFPRSALATIFGIVMEGYQFRLFMELKNRR